MTEINTTYLQQQIRLAEQYGYVESMGDDYVRHGDLVPFNDETSPLDFATIARLHDRGFAPGRIYPTKPLTERETRK